MIWVEVDGAGRRWVHGLVIPNNKTMKLKEIKELCNTETIDNEGQSMQCLMHSCVTKAIEKRNERVGLLQSVP